MQKKGTLLWKFGRELLGAAILILTFIGVSYSYGTGEAMLKIRTAKDIGLMIEEMYLIPDNINAYIAYPEDTSKIDVTIQDDTVKVSSMGADVTEGAYKFVVSSNYPSLDRLIKKPKKIYTGKINGNIIINDKEPDLRELQCSGLKTKLTISKILVDSGLDDGNIEKAKIANSIAFSLISKLERDYQVEHARNEDINTLMDNPVKLVESKLNQKIEGSDLIIKLQISEKQDSSNNIKVYFSSNSIKKEEVSALGCTILNSLIKNEILSQITGIAVIPKEGEAILNNNKVSMIVEVGNYLNPNSLSMLKDVKTIETITSTVYNTIKHEETK